jgi:Multicopper oxidase
MTDWGHNSAFEAIWPTSSLKAPSILLNGVVSPLVLSAAFHLPLQGNVTRYTNSIKNTSSIPAPYTLNFDPPLFGRAKRYLLRLINTSFESTFVFSIDNHTLTIVGMDFVPITRRDPSRHTTSRIFSVPTL